MTEDTGQSPSPFIQGLAEPNISDLLENDMMVLGDRFNEIVKFLNMFDKAHDYEANAAVEVGKSLPTSAWDYGHDPIGDELFVLGNCWRIACASALLRSYALVEATLRGAYFTLLNVIEKRGAVSTERLMKWRKTFGRHGGLHGMVEEFRYFVNSSGVRVDAKLLTRWGDVDDLRLLCNAFKHAGGVVEWKTNADLSTDERRILALMDQTLDSKATGRYEIEFESLDVQRYVTSSESFCRDLLTGLARLLDGSEIRP